MLERKVLQSAHDLCCNQKCIVMPSDMLDCKYQHRVQPNLPKHRQGKPKLIAVTLVVFSWSPSASPHVQRTKEIKRPSTLQRRLLLFHLKWREIENLICLRNAKRRDFRSRHGLLDTPHVRNDDFRRLFCFEKALLGALLSALEVPESFTAAQGAAVPGDEALCMMLRCLAYPNRLFDHERVFGRDSSTISGIANLVISHVHEKLGHLLSDMNNHSWLPLASLELFSQVRPCAFRVNFGLQRVVALFDVSEPFCRPLQFASSFFGVD
ncbi:uncharacterized protein LOC115332062 [Ixodes scapularis]|uniref:uncharacterized protein LOC115332062 n=1 Tax=Ixodes scapularis TaxID=6945 RepID=UPI001A9E9A04|nr:uncharacterized protein LOC115332062 [Ixodes scapularis]